MGLLIKELFKTMEPNKKILYLVPTRELLYQSCHTLQMLMPDKIVGIEMGKHEAPDNADIIIASVATLHNRLSELRYLPKLFGALFDDECHHSVTKSHLKILSHFGADTPETTIPLFGFTATLTRTDGLSLGKVFDVIGYNLDFQTLIRRGYLSPIKLTMIETKVDLSAVKTVGGDFETKSLNREVNTPEMNELICRTWAHQSDFGKKYKSTLIFGVTIEHILALEQVFLRNGVNAVAVSGKTPAKLRDEIVRKFRASEIQVLLNCGVFTEGTDLPNISMLILARPTKSAVLYMQMLGRGMRLHPGKDHCHFIDMVGSNLDAMITVPTLMGLDVDQVYANVDVMKALEENEKRPKEDCVDGSNDAAAEVGDLSGFLSKWVLKSYDSLEDFLVEDSGQDKRLKPSNRFYNWLTIDENTFVLASFKGFLKLVCNPSNDGNKEIFTLYRYSEIPAHLSNARYKRSKALGEFTDLERALTAAETLASNLYPRNSIIKGAKWRYPPSTDGQRKSIKKILTKFKKHAGDEVNDKWVDKLTKGEAFDFLCLSTIGKPQTIMRSLLKKQKKAKRDKARKVEMDILSSIKVGPIMKEKH